MLVVLSLAIAPAVVLLAFMIALGRHVLGVLGSLRALQAEVRPLGEHIASQSARAGARAAAVPARLEAASRPQPGGGPDARIRR